MTEVILNPCLATPEDMGIFSYFCLPRNSFQMELFGCENAKALLDSHDTQTILRLHLYITIPISWHCWCTGPSWPPCL